MFGDLWRFWMWVYYRCNGNKITIKLHPTYYCYHLQYNKYGVVGGL